MSTPVNRFFYYHSWLYFECSKEKAVTIGLETRKYLIYSNDSVIYKKIHRDSYTFINDD